MHGYSRLLILRNPNPACHLWSHATTCSSIFGSTVAMGKVSRLNHCVVFTNSTRTVIMPTPPLNNHCSMFGLSDSADTPKTLLATNPAQLLQDNSVILFVYSYYLATCIVIIQNSLNCCLLYSMLIYSKLPVRGYMNFAFSSSISQLYLLLLYMLSTLFYIIIIAQCISMVLSGMDLYWNQSSRLQHE